LILDVSENPLARKGVDPLFLKAWFPSLHTFIDDRGTQVKEISCFERFGDLAFRRAEVVSPEVIGGVTLSMNGSPEPRTPLTKIDLRSIMPSPAVNRQLIFGEEEEPANPLSVAEGQTPLKRMLQIPVKNDSLKYFNAFSKEGGDEQLSTSSAYRLSHTSLSGLPAFVNAVRHARRESARTEPPRYEESKEVERGHFYNMSQDDNSEIASYYENLKATMCLQMVKNMPLKDGCKIQGERNRTPVRPAAVKAMMIAKPPELGRRQSSLLKLHRVKDTPKPS